MRFEYPEFFYLIIPWLLFCLIILLHQGLAHSWLKHHVSSRFLSQFTRYTKPKLIIHVFLIFFSGLALIWTLAGPYKSGRIEKISQARNIYFIIDSSFSMQATDTYELTDKDVSAKTRFEAAKDIAIDLITKLPHDNIGLITFSGESVVHATPTQDHDALITMIRNLELHKLRHMGSDFSKPLQDLIHAAQFQPAAYSAILLSDGEPMPENQNYNHQLQTLKLADIPIITIGLGSETGAELSLFDPLDLYNNILTPKLIKVIKTKRNSNILRQIARATGGAYFELERGTWTDAVLDQLSVASESTVKDWAQGKIDNSHPALVVFLILFFIEILFLYPKKAKFVVFIFLALSNSNCETTIFKAHKENEAGIDKYQIALFDLAREYFETSYFYHVKEEIPLLNIGNDYLQKKDFGTAHKYYQRAIRSNPDQALGYFNDGVALFLWGEDEIDPRGCFLARSAELFDQAIDRFEESQKKGLLADKNIAFIKKRIKDLYELHANAKNCPESKNNQYSYQSKHAPKQQQQQQNNQNQDQNQDQNQQQQQQQTQENQNQQQQKNQQNQNQNQNQSQDQQQNQNQNQHQQNQQQKQPQQNDNQQQNNQNQNQNQNQQGQQNNNSKLTQDEQRTVEENLKRIRDESKQNVGYNQTDKSQNPKNEGDVDREILW